MGESQWPHSVALSCFAQGLCQVMSKCPVMKPWQDKQGRVTDARGRGDVNLILYTPRETGSPKEKGAPSAQPRSSRKGFFLLWFWLNLDAWEVNTSFLKRLIIETLGPDKTHGNCFCSATEKCWGQNQRAPEDPHHSPWPIPGRWLVGKGYWKGWSQGFRVSGFHQPFSLPFFSCICPFSSPHVQSQSQSHSLPLTVEREQSFLWIPTRLSLCS